MDVWLDSGMAWGCARDVERCGDTVDLVVEGVDQFRGWFQSLLLTSFALQVLFGTVCCLTQSYFI